MPADLRQLRPAELVRLMNSTPLGEVITDHRFRRHRAAAGFRIGDDKGIHLLRYVAWLFQQWRDLTTDPDDPGLTGYEAQRERARLRSEDIARSGREIGELPAVAKPRRRKSARTNFALFCEKYFPETFYLPWSDDHRKVIAKIEDSVLKGGLFAVAMPRGSGKTSLCTAACLWALLYGHRQFVCLLGSDEGKALSLLEALKIELECNERLLEDFPEVCVPINKLDGIHQRKLLYRGERVRMDFTQTQMSLPWIPGSPAAGSIVRVSGITGSIRGMQSKLPDGRTIRPDLVIVDDPQTDRTAWSDADCKKIERILAGAVLGLAGPGKKIAGIIPCTVIRESDVADRLLDRKQHPEFRGERTRLIYAMPTRQDLWEQYAEVRATELQNEGDGSQANAFYEQHREKMDLGAKVAWEHRFNDDELSAIQHAMNLLYFDEYAFWAEYQNQPQPDEEIAQLLSKEEIAGKTNGYARGTIPIAATHLTSFIDIQGKLLYWMVCGWSDDFTGYVIDYGTWPKQSRSWFTLRSVRRTLMHATKTQSLEAAIYAALSSLVKELMNRKWEREDGAELNLNRIIPDANWGASTDTVYEFCRESSHATVLIPGHGRYVGPSSVPWSEIKRRPGEQIGDHWQVPNVRGKRAIRHVLFDTNYWKSFVFNRLSAPQGEKGCLSLFGREPRVHQLLAEHLTAERKIPTEGRGRKVDVWELPPQKPDNHWFDCLVGCTVGASMQGLTLMGRGVKARGGTRREKVSYHKSPAQLRALKRQGDRRTNRGF